MDEKAKVPTALEEVTEAAFNGVLAALERRQIEIRHFPGPIIIGFVAWPELRAPEEAGKIMQQGG